jgi:hypothetical protein
MVCKWVALKKNSYKSHAKQTEEWWEVVRDKHFPKVAPTQRNRGVTLYLYSS